MLDGILNFKTHFMVWYCVWYEHCNGLFNIRNLVSSLILMFVRICLCDTILYTWFGKKWKRSKKFWGWKICLVYAYFLKHLSLSMLISLMLIKKECMTYLPLSKLVCIYHRNIEIWKSKFCHNFFLACLFSSKFPIWWCCLMLAWLLGISRLTLLRCVLLLQNVAYK